MIYYLYRQTQNWKKKRISNFWYLNATKSQKKLEKYIEEWNKCNEIDYFKFRQILKNVSQKTFNNIKKIEINEIKNLQPEDWVIPFDDDDWFFYPFKFEIEKSKSDFVYGDVVFYDIHSGNLEKKQGNQQSSLFSCQYCIRVKALETLNTNSFKNILQYHYLAKQEIIENNINFEYIPNLISARVFHLGATDKIIRSESLNPKIYFKKKDEPSWLSLWASTIEKTAKNKIYL